MSSSASIRYYRSTEIDRDKWDACVAGAAIPGIFACSTYLNRMADNWDALVLGDYEAVMPLPWKKQKGIYTLYQPDFSWLGGVFGTADLRAFIHAIPSRFRKADVTLNPGNVQEDMPAGCILRQQFILKLDRPYAELKQSFSASALRNSARCRDAGMMLRENIPISEIAHLLTAHTALRDSINENSCQALNELTDMKDIDTRTFAVASPAGDLLAATIILSYANRLYAVVAITSPNGKTLGAYHFLLDALIEKYGGTGKIVEFGFAGSRGPDLVYTGFGAVQVQCPVLRYSNIPWYIRLISG